MLTSIEGVYRNGQIELKEPPTEGSGDVPVIVTFLDSEGFDLRARGINRAQAAELRAAFTSFTDWDEAEMDVYDDYDSVLDV